MTKLKVIVFTRVVTEAESEVKERVHFPSTTLGLRTQTWHLLITARTLGGHTLIIALYNTARAVSQ